MIITEEYPQKLTNMSSFHKLNMEKEVNGQLLDASLWAKKELKQGLKSSSYLIKFLKNDKMKNLGIEFYRRCIYVIYIIFLIYLLLTAKK